MLHGNKVRPLTVTIVLLIVSAYFLNHFVFNSSDKHSDFNSELKKTSDQINQMTPIEADEEIRLDSTKAPGSNTLEYFLTCKHIVKDNFNVDSFKTAKIPEIIDGFRSHPNFKVFRENEVTIVSHYFDSQKQFMAKIVVGPNMYNHNSSY
jgi:hypothetical protein